MAKLAAHYKIAIIFVIFVVLLWAIPLFTEKVMQHREEQTNKFMKKYGSPLIENFDIGDSLKSAFKPLTEGIDSIIEKIKFVFEAIPRLFQGINSHVDCAGKELNDGYSNGLAVLGILLHCTGQAIVNFFNGKCTIYYILDIIFGTMYKVFIELPIVLLKAILGLDLQFIVDIVFDVAILPVDGLIYGISGYHITQWPDSVVKLCYNCTGTIGGKEITQTYNDWGKMFNCTNAEIEHGTKKIFYSIFPVDGHWATWAQGNHLDGADDAV
jgi:hypothetical protein